jgi:outer membrane protein assembly factor BamB
MTYTHSSANLLFVGVNGYVVALNKSNGAKIWDKPLTGVGFKPVLMVPHLASNTLVVSAGPNLRSLNMRNGQLVWENKLTGMGFGYAMIAQGGDSVQQSVGNTSAGGPSRSSTPHQSQPPLLSPPTPQTPPSYESMTASATLASTSKSTDTKESVEPPSVSVAVPVRYHRDPEDIAFVATNFIVRAIRISDGVDLWQHSTSIIAGSSSLPALLIEDGVLYVAGNGRVYALNPLNGQQIWFQDIGYREHCTLATVRSGDPTLNIPTNRRQDNINSGSRDSKSGGRVTDFKKALFVGANGYVTAISKENGERLPIPSGSICGDVPLRGTGFYATQVIPLPSDNKSYLAASGINLRLYRMETGAMVWENKLSGMGLGMLNVLVGSGVDIRRSSLSPESQRPQQPEQQEMEPLPAYTAVNVTTVSPPPSPSSSRRNNMKLSDIIYVSLNNKVRAIDIPTGRQIWSYEHGNMGFFSAFPLPNLFIEDGKIFITGGSPGSFGSRQMLCLDACNGQLVWKTKGNIHQGFAFVGSLGSGNGETNRSHGMTLLVTKEEADENARRNN